MAARLKSHGKMGKRTKIRLSGRLLPGSSFRPAAFLGIPTRSRRLGLARGASSMGGEDAADVRAAVGAFQCAHSGFIIAEC